MNYYLIAGESSGDLHGANLIAAIAKHDTAARFRIVGGDKMAEASGQVPLLHTSQMSFMGFVEVVANLRQVLSNLKTVKADLLSVRPDALILIDFPGFNLRVADFAKKQGLKVFYYISPKVWAWNTKRVEKIKRIVDHLFCILPFEVEFYEDWGMKVDYVGNPLLDAVSAYTFNEHFLSDNNLDAARPIIALLPGSRKMEISKLLPEMVKLVGLFPMHRFVIAGAPNFEVQYYKQYMGAVELPILFNQTYDLLKHASAAVVASGTATLEAALLHVPQVVVYKANPLTIAIARRLINVAFISLVNLILDDEVVKELIQQEANYDDIADELDLLLNSRERRDQVLAEYARLDELMGAPGASDRVATLLMRYLETE